MYINAVVCACTYMQSRRGGSGLPLLI